MHTKHMILTDLFSLKTMIIIFVIALSAALFSLNASTIFNVYAQQQGGSAASGSATGGAATGQGGPCYNCVNNIYGGPATSGPATGGSASGMGNTGGSAGNVSDLMDKGNAQLNYTHDYADAIIYYDKALAVDPNNKAALAHKGWALLDLGNYAEAMPYIDKALAIDPNYKDALNNKGAALSYVGKNAEAIQYFDKVLAIDPNDKSALDNRQFVLSHMGSHNN
jgi:tetratricopeptide (TPR) repeat protein